MTIKNRLEKLEVKAVQNEVEPAAMVLIYDPNEPKPPAISDPKISAVVFIPDNGRSNKETQEKDKPE